jgi:hypothetical protein
MGGAFAQSSAGWQVVSYDTDRERRGALGRVGIALACPARSPSRRPSHHKLAESVGARGDRRRHRCCARARVVIEASTFKLEDKGRRKRLCARPAHPARLSVGGTGIRPRPRTS